MLRDVRVCDVLEALVGNTPHVDGAAVLCTDGRVIAAQLPTGCDETQISATVAAMMPPATALSAGFGRGRLEQMLLTGEAGHMLLREAGPEAVLCALGSPTVKLGTLLLATANAAASIASRFEDMPVEPAPVTAAEQADRMVKMLHNAAGFTRADQELLTRLWPDVRAALPGLTERFYAVLKAEPHMAALIAGREARLRQMHAEWLESLFAGEYGQDFFRRQEEIAEDYVCAGIRPVYFAANMAFLRTVFPPTLRACVPDLRDAEAASAALLRLLTFCQQIIDAKYAQAFIRPDERASSDPSPAQG